MGAEDRGGRGPAATTPPGGLRALSEEAVASFADAASPRLREVLQSLVRHLHGFAQEVGLTEQEWEAAIDFLTRVGEVTTDERQEFVLLSDVLGLSMLTVGLNHPAEGQVTESTVFGPFFVAGSPRIELGGDVARGASGEPAYVEGTIRDEEGAAIAGARIEVWEADDAGFYDVQYEGGPSRGRAHLYSDQEGRYRFWCVKPSPYPIPDDGPVGELLAAAGRSPMRPAHLHFKVDASGFRTLITHIFVAGSDHLDDDAVFGVKPSLIVDFEPQPPGPAPEGRTLSEPWCRARFDIVLGADPAAC